MNYTNTESAKRIDLAITGLILIIFGALLAAGTLLAALDADAGEPRALLAALASLTISIACGLNGAFVLPAALLCTYGGAAIIKNSNNE